MADDGPFETEDAARMTPAVRAIYDTARRGRPGSMRTASSALITRACGAARIALGGYDKRIIAWMGNWGPEVCQVIAGLIRRAYEAGRKPEPGTVTQWAVRYPSHIQPYDDEDMARRMARRAAREVALLAPQQEPQVMCRQVGPWKEASDA